MATEVDDVRERETLQRGLRRGRIAVEERGMGKQRNQAGRFRVGARLAQSVQD